ncbi:hypothetical protein HDV02_000934 [Globomyces sp. JEL0801]|nr:hypothetical protein HDV02_000934 [Globomyces sp. JEL0801]
MSLINRVLPRIAHSRINPFELRPFGAFDPFVSFDSHFNNLLQPEIFQPSIDLKETKDSYIVKANVPGFTKDQLSISVRGDTLHLRGVMEKSEETKDEKQLSIERIESNFARSIVLPGEVNPEKISASLTDGVLNVAIPKENVAKPESVIPIQ